MSNKVNGVKVRETLKRIYDWFDDGGLYEEAADEMDDMLEEAKNALAEPPRNCDRHPTPPDAMLAHLAEVYEGEKVEFGDYEWSEFVKWLYAVAEGGAK